MSELPPDLAELCARVQCACRDVADARTTLNKTRAETQEVLALARQTRPIDWTASTETGHSEPFRKLDLNSPEAAYTAATTIRAILDEFPLYWQVAIVKALGARTAILAQQRQQAPPTLSA